MTASPYAAVPEVIAAVERGDADGGVVPIENMIEGSVSVTLDTLAFDSDLLIQREIDLPVSLNLCARPGVGLDDVRTVVSFPHALAQCRGWLAKKLPDGRDARLALHLRRGPRGVEVEAHRHGRDLQLARGRDLRPRGARPSEIEDHPENQTRFVLVGRGVPAPTGHDKTSIVCFQREDQPGSLLPILQEFAARAINLTKLESRPTKRGLGDYCFFIDCEGHISDEVVADALRNLVAKQAEVKFLGSYPGRRTGRGRRRPAQGRRAGVEERGRVGRDAARADPGPSIRGAWVIDLKRLRDEPEYRRGIERKRVRAGLIDEVLAADAAHRRVRAGGRGAARPPERGEQGDRQGRARRARRRRSRPPGR